MNTTPKPGQIAMLAGGAVLLIFSFLDWRPEVDLGFGSSIEGITAWTDFGVFTWPALFGIVIAGTLAATLFGNVALPDPVLTFNWQQIRLVLSFTALLILLGFLFMDGDKGIGFWFSLLGGIAVTAGSVMDLLDTSEAGPAAARPGSQPPSPF